MGDAAGRDGPLPEYVKVLLREPLVKPSPCRGALSPLFLAGIVCSLNLQACHPATVLRDSAEDSALPTDTGAPLPDTQQADDPLWDRRGMPVFYLYIDDDNWADALWELVDLDDECADRPYLEASLDFLNPMTGELEEWDNVGVRYRGHSSLLGGEYERVGLKLSFNEFESGRLFHGVKKINLLGTEGDYSLMREHLTLLLMERFGLPVPRSAYALLYVNDEFQGVFPNTEEPDDSAFLDNHFASDASGSLYKVAGYCGGSGDFEYLGDDTSMYVEIYEPKAGTSESDISQDLLPFITCASESDTFESCMSAWIDVDEWLAEIAADVVLPDIDGMEATGQNFMLYFQPDQGRFVVYPWDKDQAFNISDAVDGDEASIFDLHPVWDPDFESVVARGLMETWTQDYCAAVLEFAELYDPGIFFDDIDDLVDFLTDFIDADPFIELERWGWMVDDLRETVEDRHPLVVQQAGECSL